MGNTAELKLNISKNKNALPYKTTRIYSALNTATAAEALVGSYITDHSRPLKPYKESKRYIADKLNLSMATIFRSLKKLDEGELIERQKRALFSLINKNRYIKYPDFLTNYEFNFKIKEGGILAEYSRRLLVSEIEIYATIYTWTTSPHNTGGFYLTSLSMLSKITGYSVNTVSHALHVLMRCGLLNRTQDNKGTSSAHMSAYRLNKDTLKKIHSQCKGVSCNTAPTPDETRKYYAEIRNAAEQEAENNLRDCLKDPIFNRLHKKERELTHKVAFTELAAEKPGANAELRQAAVNIRKEFEEVKAQRLARLEELGYYEEDLIPKYRCKLCSDTGIDKKTGTTCKCYFTHWNLPQP